MTTEEHLHEFWTLRFTRQTAEVFRVLRRVAQGWRLLALHGFDEMPYLSAWWNTEFCRAIGIHIFRHLQGLALIVVDPTWRGKGVRYVLTLVAKELAARKAAEEAT